MKRLLLILTLAIAAGMTSVHLFDRFHHPELNFFSRVSANADEWEQQMRQLGKPCTIICGASETRMGVEPAVMMEELGLPAVNAGCAAGHGMYCNAAMAIRYLHPGDTLLFSLQSLSDLAVAPTTSGLKLATRRVGLGLYSSGFVPLNFKHLKMTFLGDSRCFCTWIAKLASGQKSLFKYDTNTRIHPSGWVEVMYRDMAGATPPLFNPPYLYAPPQDAEIMLFLHDLADYCEAHDNRLIIHIPIGFYHPSYQAQNAFLALQLTRKGFTVLRDERLGVIANPAAFSDMGSHPTGDVARENSRIIGQALKYKEYWTETELISLLRFMGWDETGHRLLW